MKGQVGPGSDLPHRRSYLPHKSVVHENSLTELKYMHNCCILVCVKSFEATETCNFDEMGIKTIEKPRKGVGPTGAKQVESSVSAERGLLVTLCAAVSADDQTIPLICFFSLLNFNSRFLDGAPPGSYVSAY